MSKTIFGTKKEKNPMLIGIADAKNIVGSTMGAAGKTVVISHAKQTMPDITKDGVTVLAAVNPEEERANVGVTLLKGAANKTVIEAGDGTTATTVLANAIIQEGSKRISAGAKPQFVKKGVDIAVKAVVEQLKKMSESIGDDNNKILNVATISANNDPEIGKLIADAYKQIGNKGLLTIEKSTTVETYTKVVQGFEFNRGYIHPYYINNPEKMQCVLDNPVILITDYTISSLKDMQDIEKVLGEIIQLGKPIMIIATDVDQIAYATFLQNKVKGGLNICIVKAPNTYKEQCLSDIAVLTNGKVISDTMGMKLKHLKLEHFGSCEKIIVTDKTTTIIGGAGDKDLITVRKEEINTMIEQTEDPEYKKVLERRSAQVAGSVGVIYVGAHTDVEGKEKYDRTDDARLAVKSAIEEGVSCGGGVALLRCIDAIDEIDLSGYNKDVQVGVDVVKLALEAPLRQMVRNAGVYQNIGLRIWNKIFKISEEESILEEIKMSEGNIGYNVRTSTIEDLKVAGVLDATKVVRVSLENAASVAGTILTSEYLLIEVKAK